MTDMDFEDVFDNLLPDIPIDSLDPLAYQPLRSVPVVSQEQYQVQRAAPTAVPASRAEATHDAWQAPSQIRAFEPDLLQVIRTSALCIKILRPACTHTSTEAMPSINDSGFSSRFFGAGRRCTAASALLDILFVDIVGTRGKEGRARLSVFARELNLHLWPISVVIGPDALPPLISACATQEASQWSWPLLKQPDLGLKRSSCELDSLGLDRTQYLARNSLPTAQAKPIPAAHRRSPSSSHTSADAGQAEDRSHSPPESFKAGSLASNKSFKELHAERNKQAQRRFRKRQKVE